MFTFTHKIYAIVLLCYLLVLPTNIFASDSIYLDILDRNGKRPYAVYNSCGGVIETQCDQTIILEYKPDEEYDNNEFCVWTIRNRECFGSLFTKTKSNLEVGYDYIQISGFKSTLDLGNGPTYTESMGNTTSMEQVSATAYVNFLIFSTDDSNTGMGFRIEIVGWWPVAKPHWSDDLNSMSPSGTTELIPYYENMLQAYVINPKLTTVPSLLLNIKYNTTFSDYFCVFSMERNGQSINFRPHSKRLIGNGTETFESVYYTNFLVLFSSNDLFPVPDFTGYTLDWYPTDGATT